MHNEDFDPIAGLYESAGSLRELAEMYRDERGGLSSLLLLIADNVTRCAGKLDCEEKPMEGPAYKDLRPCAPSRLADEKRPRVLRGRLLRHALKEELYLLS